MSHLLPDPRLDPIFPPEDAAACFPDSAALRRGVVAVLVLVVVANVAALAFVQARLPPWPSFVPLHAAGVFLTEAITAFLLFGQIRSRPVWPTLLLGAGYCCGATLVIPFLLSFPVPGQGSLIGGPQSSVWLWHFWHLLFPSLIVAALRSETVPPPSSPHAAKMVAAATVFGCLALAALAIWGEGLLPDLIDPGPPLTLTRAFFLTGSAALLLSLVALALCAGRARSGSALHLWLAVALTAFAFDVLLSLLSETRYSVGWYFGRINSLVASSALLLMLLSEVSRLQARLFDGLQALRYANSHLETLVREKDHLLGTIQERTRRLTSEIGEHGRAEARLAAALRDLRLTNEDMERFAYVAAHDLRTPLHGISGFVALLERRYADRLDKDGREFLGHALDAVRQMDRLIDGLLEYVHIGRQEPAQEPISLREAALSASRALERRGGDVRAQITIPLDMPSVKGNFTELARLFFELMDNAIKYRHPDRPPHVVLSSRRVGNGWEIRVCDNGSGIGPEYSQRVFQLFMQLHPPTVQDGCGLGLPICRKIVERHGGAISVSPNPAGGSCFSIDFPDSLEDGVALSP